MKFYKGIIEVLLRIDDEDEKEGNEWNIESARQYIHFLEEGIEEKDSSDLSVCISASASDFVTEEIR